MLLISILSGYNQ